MTIDEILIEGCEHKSKNCPRCQQIKSQVLAEIEKMIPKHTAPKGGFCDKCNQPTHQWREWNNCVDLTIANFKKFKGIE